jgi:hypothetical protein
MNRSQARLAVVGGVFHGDEVENVSELLPDEVLGLEFYGGESTGVDQDRVDLFVAMAEAGEAEALLDVYEDSIKDCLSSAGQTALMAAAAARQQHVVRLLVDCRCTWTVRDAAGNIALHVACNTVDQVSDIVDVLLGMMEELSRTPDLLAAAWTNSLGETPLHFAAAQGVPRIIKVLLSFMKAICPSLISRKNAAGLAASDVAAAAGHVEAAETIRAAEAKVCAASVLAIICIG